MVDKITITFNNNIILLDIKKEKYTYNNMNISFDAKKLMELLRIIRTWDSEYIDNSLIDSTIYLIEIISGEEIDTYKICNKYPDNFNDFIFFLENLYA